MTNYRLEDPLGSRELRRLTHSSAVPTTYASRDAESEVMLVHQAVRQGYEQGYAEGLAAAIEEAERMRAEESGRIETALAGLARAIAEMRDADTHLRSEIAKSAPRLAFALLEQLLARELELTTNPGREAIVRTLALDEATLPATVRLNPADVDKLGEIADLDLGREIMILADPEVHVGGALVEMGNTTLDGQVDTALERVKKVLFGSSAVDFGYDQAV